MNAAEYEWHKRTILELAESIENGKRPGYTGQNEDVLHNFKAVADRLGLTPAQCWGVYMLKHADAITTWAKDSHIPQAEALPGRFADMINYTKLGYALYKEGEHGLPVHPQKRKSR